MLKSGKKTIIAAAAFALLAGCAGNTPTYYKIDSLARNAASAGGVYGVRDFSVPREEVGNFTESVEFGAIYTAAGLSGTALGLSSLGGGLLHLVEAVTDEGPDASRVTLFAWMPESYASDKAAAKAKMFTVMNQAIRKSLDDLQLEYTPVESDNHDLSGYYIHSDKFGCPAPAAISKSKHHNSIPFAPVRTEACVVRASIKTTAGFRNTPSDVRIAGHTEPKSYSFLGSTDRKQMNAIHVQRGVQSTLPENILYSEISKNLPPWVFMHLGPGRVSVTPEHNIPFPYLLNKGEPHFYIRPS